MTDNSSFPFDIRRFRHGKYSWVRLVIFGSLLAWLWMNRSQDPKNTTALEAFEQQGKRPPPALSASPKPAGPGEAPTEEVVVKQPDPTAPPMEQLFSVVNPGKALISCSANGIVGDGVYRAAITGPQNERKGKGIAQHPTVQHGTLTAAVTEANGEVFLSQQLQALALLSWSGAESGTSSCRIEGLARVPIEGVVTNPDGSPAADALVRACDFGELVRTDEEGHFSFTGVLGSDCQPMAFYEGEDGFGKGSYEYVPIDSTEPIDDLVLTLPTKEEIMSPKVMRNAAEQLATMSERGILHHQKNQASLEAVQSVFSTPETTALLEAWIANEEDRIARINEQRELLLDPESQLDAFVEAFLSQY